MTKPEDRPQKTSTIERIKSEFINSPLGSLGALAGILGLVIARPEVLGLHFMTSSQPNMHGGSGLVTWLILYIAICFFFAKWASMVSRYNAITGVLLSGIFGVLVSAIGVYLASVYLVEFPIEVSIVGLRESYSWVGIHLTLFAGLLSVIWTLLILAMFANELTLVRKRIFAGRDVEEPDPIAVFAGAFTLVAGLVHGSLAYAFIVGIVGLPEIPVV